VQRRRCHTAMHRSLQQRMRNGAPDGTQTHSIRRVGVRREAHLRSCYHRDLRRRRRAHHHDHRHAHRLQHPQSSSSSRFHSYELRTTPMKSFTPSKEARPLSHALTSDYYNIWTLRLMVWSGGGA
jgi:hypothetical protein